MQKVSKLPRFLIGPERPSLHPRTEIDKLLALEELDKAGAGDLLLSARAGQRGYFRREAVDRLLTEHRRCSADHGLRLWVLLFLELWFREFVDSPS